MRFNEGDIVYWCRQEGHEFSVMFGMIEEQFSDAVIVDILELKETRKINGIPIDEFPSETKYKKLPKRWSYDTKLFDVTYGEIGDERANKYLNAKINEPEIIKQMYDDGILVKANTKFHGVIEAEIDNNGYRIVKKYPMWRKPVITHTSVNPRKCYFTYQEALDEVTEHVKEFERQASLSDKEWSIEQIDKTISRSMLTKDEASKVRKWLLSMDNVEDLCTRLYGGLVQWKYDKNKKWNNVEIN